MEVSHSGIARGSYVYLHAKGLQEQGLFFAKCRELNLVSQGNSETEAIVKLVNMITASLTVAKRRGNLDAVLKGSGTQVPFNSVVPEDTEAEGFGITIPTPQDAGAGPVAGP